MRFETSLYFMSFLVKMDSSFVSQTNNTHTDTQSKIHQYTEVR